MVKLLTLYGDIVAFTNKLVETKNEQINSHLLSIINEKSCNMVSNDPFLILNKEKISRLCLSKKLLFLKLLTPILEVALKTQPQLNLEVIFDSYLQKIINISSVIALRLNIEVNEKNQWKINVINKLVSQYVCQLDLSNVEYNEDLIVKLICGNQKDFELIHNKYADSISSSDAVHLRLFFTKLSGELLVNILLNNSLQCDPYVTLPKIIDFLISTILNFNGNLMSDIQTPKDNLILLENICLDILPIFYHCWRKEEDRVQLIMESLPTNKKDRLLNKYKEVGFPIENIFSNFCLNIDKLLPLLLKLSS